MIIDDEEGIRLSLRGILEDEGYAVEEASSAEEGLQKAEASPPDMIFLDIWLPGMDGLEALDMFKLRFPDLPVVMISGHGNIETAVDALRRGAHDFIEKPLSLEKVLLLVQHTLEMGELRRENKALRAAMEQSEDEIIGQSPAMTEFRQELAHVAPTDAWVLITGENGTGKELAARAVHRNSRRADAPLVAVNCAAIPEELIESELFGHEKGAFTGADSSRAGKFELAHKGTLFLDEIGDMSLKTQAKILRILQEQSFERVGGMHTLKVDVRVIAATNRILADEVRARRFREDLYYRLNVLTIRLPALRERADDLPALALHFLQRFGAASGRKHLVFSPECFESLTRHHWPGNVRELANTIERTIALAEGSVISRLDLPNTQQFPERGLPAMPPGTLRSREMEAIFETLKANGGNMRAAAQSLGIARSALYRKLHRYGFTPDLWRGTAE